jgi:hypothetical protein
MELTGKKWDGVEWINLALYMDMWRELVNAVLNIPVPCNEGNFLLSYRTGSI